VLFRDPVEPRCGANQQAVAVNGRDAIVNSSSTFWPITLNPDDQAAAIAVAPRGRTTAR
jgi:hypothetical protein